MKIVEVSKIAYNMNRTVKTIVGIGNEIEIILPEWENTSQNYKDMSCICTRCILLHSETAHPAEWFEDFKKFMYRAGWTYGEMRDDVKTHPYLTDYEKLTDSMRQRLHLYCSVVNGYRRKISKEKAGHEQDSRDTATGHDTHEGCGCPDDTWADKGREDGSTNNRQQLHLPQTRR